MRIPVFIHDRIYIPRAPIFDELLESIRVKFNYANPKYSQLKAIGRWTGGVERRLNIWDHVSHPDFGDCLSVPRGGLSKVRKAFEQEGYTPHLIDRRVTHEPITDLFNDVTLRPDQERLAAAMMKVQNCLIRSPTGSGKTETALKAAEYMLKDAGPVLVIVWETELMDQWVERICQRFGLREKDVGMVGGRKKKRIKPLTVGMQQSLRNKIRIYAPQFGGVICDEVQRFAATTYEHVIDLMPAKYRIGISADETRRDKQEFRIYDMFGEVAEEIERAALIKQGKLHDVIIRCIPTDFDYILEVDDEELTWAELEAENKDTNDLLDILCDDDERNDLIWHFMSPVLKQKHSTLVITRRVEHAKYWEYRIRSEGYKCGLMIGGRENETVFKTTKRGLLNGNIQVAVGTIQKIGQALDIPPWERGFIISPCAQNKQQFEQILGRLRRTSEGKTEAVCYYIWDKYLYPGIARSLSNRYPSVFIWDDEGFLPVS